ncbi:MULTISPECIES: hypothetical protein [Pseudomonas]|uniref:hypothetical protein n=1 Tax=Pseudomonas TaxID=286 RepID=UPI0030D9D919
MEIEMTSAFKYAEKKYSDSLLALGSVRIGTLHDFRNSEHKPGIIDANEGRKTITHHIAKASTTDGDTIHTRAMKAFKAIGYDSKSVVHMKDCHFTQEFDHPNMYIHCLSAEYSSKVMREFDGSDSCVEIVNLHGFYRRLTQTLKQFTPVDFLGVSQVTYMDRDQPWNGSDWGENPALIKEHEFRNQVEIRAVWWSKTGKPIEPIILNDVGLIEFCARRQTP